MYIYGFLKTYTELNFQFQACGKWNKQQELHIKELILVLDCLSGQCFAACIQTLDPDSGLFLFWKKRVQTIAYSVFC